MHNCLSWKEVELLTHIVRRFLLLVQKINLRPGLAKQVSLNAHEKHYSFLHRNKVYFDYSQFEENYNQIKVRTDLFDLRQSFQSFYFA